MGNGLVLLEAGINLPQADGAVVPTHHDFTGERPLDANALLGQHPHPDIPGRRVMGVEQPLLLEVGLSVPGVMTRLEWWSRGGSSGGATGST